MELIITGAMVTGAVVGIITGTLTTLSLIGASRNNRDNEVYMEGFLAGQEDERSKHENQTKI